MECLLDPPQIPERLPPAHDLDVTPGRTDRRDVAALQVLDHDRGTAAGFRFGVSHPGCVGHADGEVGVHAGPCCAS